MANHPAEEIDVDSLAERASTHANAGDRLFAVAGKRVNAPDITTLSLTLHNKASTERMVTLHAGIDRAARTVLQTKTIYLNPNETFEVPVIVDVESGLVSELPDYVIEVESDKGAQTEAVVASAFLDGLKAAQAELGESLRLMPAEDLVRLGQDAAREIVSSLQWSAAVGERLDTTAVTSMLGISRQALANRRASGSLIALEGTGTSFWPTWQFDRSDGAVSVRPVVLQVVSAFREYLGERADSFLIASWASTSQDELEGATPAEWISAGKDDDRVIEAAVQAASAEAR